MPYLYETHMHTSEVSSCGRSTAAEQVRAYRDRGYTGVIVTDHFINGRCTCHGGLSWKEKMEYFASGFVKAKEAGDACGLSVFFAWEYTVKGDGGMKGFDFLTYGLGLDFLLAHPGVDALSLAAYSALVRSCGGCIVIAHPFRYAHQFDDELPISPALLDGVEVYNASMPAEVNAKARAFAERYGLPMQAGSDAHDVALPFASGIRLDKKAESAGHIMEAVRLGKAKLILP